MTILLRPPGSGNWTPIVLQLAQSRHSPVPIEVHVGQQWTLAGRIYRVAQVLP